MNKYNINYRIVHPLMHIVNDMRENNYHQYFQEINDPEKLVKILDESLLNIHCIKDASIESLASNFCMYEINPWHCGAESIQKKEHELGKSFNFNTAQRKTIFILNNLFPQFSEWVDNSQNFDYVNDVRNIKWSVTYNVTHRFLHTVEAECASHTHHNHLMWYTIQLLYRSGCWLKGFQVNNNFKWNLPMFINLWHATATKSNHMIIHPGNSRNLFKEFDKTTTDAFVVSPAKFENKFPKVDDYEYYDTFDVFSEILKTKRAECILKENQYFEAFFLPRTQRSLNDATVLFFGPNKWQRDRYLDHCRQIEEHKRNPRIRHPEKQLFSYLLNIKLEDSVIYYNDEAVARFDDDGCLLLETENKEFSFNFL